MFLEIITRCYKRPVMLAANVASIEAQTSHDWVHTLLHDDVGRGIGWAQAQLADYEPTGDYIWILDDDNRCTLPTLVEELVEIVMEHDPHVIMLQAHRGGAAIPGKGYWQKPPQCGHVDAACYVVRRDWWQEHAQTWRGARYQSDYDFIHSLWDGGAFFVWHDVVASEAQRVSLGAPE